MMKLIFKTRVVFRLKGDDKLQIGYLIKDKYYDGGCCVKTLDEKSRYTISLIDVIERI